LPPRRLNYISSTKYSLGPKGREGISLRIRLWSKLPQLNSESVMVVPFFFMGLEFMASLRLGNLWGLTTMATTAAWASASSALANSELVVQAPMLPHGFEISRSRKGRENGVIFFVFQWERKQTEAVAGHRGVWVSMH